MGRESDGPLRPTEPPTGPRPAGPSVPMHVMRDKAIALAAHDFGALCRAGTRWLERLEQDPR